MKSLVLDRKSTLFRLVSNYGGLFKGSRRETDTCEVSLGILLGSASAALIAIAAGVVAASIVCFIMWASFSFAAGVQLPEDPFTMLAQLVIVTVGGSAAVVAVIVVILFLVWLLAKGTEKAGKLHPIAVLKSTYIDKFCVKVELK